MATPTPTPTECVLDDTERAYIGYHSFRSTLSASSPHALVSSTQRSLCSWLTIFQIPLVSCLKATI